MGTNLQWIGSPLRGFPPAVAARPADWSR